MTIHYAISPIDLSGHLFQVTLHVANPSPRGQVFSLPAWIPGSYMIREYARHIVQIKASCEGEPVCITKLDKHSWQAQRVNGALEVIYHVYAWDLSVRGAHLDQTHGFFNGVAVFLRVLGQEFVQHVVDIPKPTDPHCKHWRVATALSLLNAKPYGFGGYCAENYDELIDHPVEMGTFSMVNFQAHGTPHDLVVTGKVPQLDLDRIANDLEKICSAQIALFEPHTQQAPMSRYVFLVMAVGEGYGGLEHRSSTALICSRSDLPVKGNPETSEAYSKFLGLCSHEYFHSWNVKRIKPAAFAPYDLQNENYTSLLWFFEGVTSYYDDLILRRAGLINEASYFELISKTLNGVVRGEGRLKQSLAESSFDAWIKFYRQDENAPNAIVSYYTKGSLLALALDLTVRRATQGAKSLDDVMRVLWEQFGRNFYAQGALSEARGVTDEQLEALIEHVAGVPMTSFFDRYVRCTEDLPLSELFADFGVDVVDKSKPENPSLGVKLIQDGKDCKLGQVYSGKAAHAAGLSAGDVLVAIDGLRVTASDVATQLKRLLDRYAVGAKVSVHAFRRDELITCDLTLQADDTPMWALQVGEKSENNSSALLPRPSA